MNEQEKRLIDLRQAKSLAESGELDMAWSTVDDYLRKNPDDSQALLLASYILDKGKHLSVAFHLARRVAELELTDSRLGTITGAWPISFG